MSIRSRGIVVSCGLAALAAASPAFGSTIFSNWNLIVRNDVNSTSEVDGSALIGGNLFGTSNYAVQGVTAAGGDGLAIGGNIGAGFNIQINNGGNLRIAGSVLGNVNLNGGGVQINDPGVPASVASAFAQANVISAALAGLTPNGTLDGAGNMSAAPSLIDGQLVAVYSINAASLQGLGQLNLNFGSADSVIINVTTNAGLASFNAPPNFVGGLNQANSSRILWNFVDATDLVVNNNFNGAILAPDADLQLLGGGINGTVIVDNISVQNAEIRRFNYTGFLIPSPTAAALFALAGLAARRRRN